MTTMENTYAKQLLQRAVDRCGSRYKLAQRMGRSEEQLANIWHDRSPLPWSWIYPVATLAGEDPGRALAAIEAERAIAQGKSPAVTALAVGGAAETFDTSARKNVERKQAAKGRQMIANAADHLLTVLHIVSSAARWSAGLRGQVKPLAPAV